jgi:hypothetical protein
MPWASASGTQKSNLLPAFKGAVNCPGMGNVYTPPFLSICAHNGALKPWNAPQQRDSAAEPPRSPAACALGLNQTTSAGPLRCTPQPLGSSH